MSFVTGSVLLVILQLASGTGTHRQTSIGEVVGAEYPIEDGTIIYRFLGIPFAYPPIDAHFRFAEPVPIEQPFATPWAATFNLQCLQVLSDLSIVGDEDCLYLNVYTPSADDTANYDVLVLIHGGEFKYGYSEDQSPDYLFANIKNIVFVSINYRLGPIGFLSTEDEIVPGNIGLKDQVVALKWVQKNIRIFGGNPDRVTIAGVGAGAVSVHLHYLSPLSQGLFAQGISLSGGALSPFVKTKNIRKETDNLAALVNCKSEKSADMVNCLKNINGKSILEQMVRSPKNTPQYSSFYPHFGPVIEKGGNAPFLDQHPFSLLQNRQVKNAPWLVSTLEANKYMPPEFFYNNLQDLNNRWNEIAPDLLRFRDLVAEDQISKISERIREEYFNKQEITRDNVYLLSKLVADRLYLINIEDAIRLHATASTAPVYLYTFNYAESNNVFKTPTEVDKNAMDDYINILKIVEVDHAENKDMIKTMVKVWQGFIQNGVPEATRGLTWPVVQRGRVTGGDLSYVRIDSPTNLNTISSPGLSNRYFWNTLPLDEPRVTGVVIEKEVKKRSRGFISRYVIGPVESVFSIFLNALRFIFVSPIEALFTMSSGGVSKP